MKRLQVSSILCLLLLSSAAFAADEAPRPHIVFLLADDLGWKDVGWHGSEIQTPNLDQLAAAGTRLEQFYVMPVCSPTRAALMTGRYPIRTGLQTGVIRPWARYGLPLEERMLSSALQEAGYSTAITGKWHLGLHEPAYLPTHRGFTHQYGHYCGALDYFTHRRDGGLDWHRDDKALVEEGYTTNLIGQEASRLVREHDVKKPLFLYVPFNAPHTPLQATEKYLAKYRDIKDPKRQKYAAMVTCLDDAVGRIVAALKEKKMIDNTLIIFSSDNGGPISLGANNAPLRGSKGTLYEGGVRVTAFATWPGKLQAGKIINEPLHMVDWYPTLISLSGATVQQKLPLDGKNLWPVLTEGMPSPHQEILLNVEKNRGAIRQGPWKLVVTGPLPADSTENLTRVELFNLKEDPNEKTSKTEAEPGRVKQLLERLNTYAKEARPAQGGKGPRPKNYKAPRIWGEKD